MKRFFASILLAIYAACAVAQVPIYTRPTGFNAANVPITGGTISGTTESGNTFSTIALNSNMRTIVQQGGVPLIGPGTFTMGNNGAITLGTALGNTTPGMNCYIYMLAGDIAAGVPAAPGFYFAQFTTTTAGTVFNNLWNGLGAAPLIASPTAFATTGPGARTGDTAAETFFQTTIPVLALNSQIIANYTALVTNNANVKTFTVKFGGTTTHSVTGNSVGRADGIFKISNTGATNKQVSEYGGLTGFAVFAQEAAGTIDTTATATLLLSVQRGTATDNVVVFPPIIEVAY